MKITGQPTRNNKKKKDRRKEGNERKKRKERERKKEKTIELVVAFLRPVGWCGHVKSSEQTKQREQQNVGSPCKSVQDQNHVWLGLYFFRNRFIGICHVLSLEVMN